MLDMHLKGLRLKEVVPDDYVAQVAEVGYKAEPTVFEFNLPDDKQYPMSGALREAAVWFLCRFANCGGRLDWLGDLAYTLSNQRRTIQQATPVAVSRDLREAFYVHEGRYYRVVEDEYTESLSQEAVELYIAETEDDAE